MSIIQVTLLVLVKETASNNTRRAASAPVAGRTRPRQILLAMKKRGFGKGWYNGTGGKVQDGETPIDACVRETCEEIGITPIFVDHATNTRNAPKPVGDILFDQISPHGGRGFMRMHVFYANDFTGELQETDEMRPEWFDIDKIPYDKMFPDDRHWLPLVLANKIVRAKFKFDDKFNLIKKSVIEVPEIGEEIFDVLDENGGYTGEIVGRTYAHDHGIWHRGVGLYLVNSKKQILLQKRPKNKRMYGGCWDMSAAGHIEAGEFGLDAIIRETKEELGISVTAADIRFLDCGRSMRKTDTTDDRHFNERYAVFRDVKIADIKYNCADVDEIRWFDFAQFKTLVENRDPTISGKWDAHELLVKYLESV